MKVLIYSEYFLPISGGVQTIVLELARGLATWKPHGSDKPIEVTIVTRTREQMAGENNQPFRLERSPTLSRLVQLVREADLLHLAGPVILPLAMGLLFHKPVIVEHHGYQSVCPNGLLLYEPDHSICPGYFMERRYSMCLRCNTQAVGRRKSVRDLVLTFPRRWMCELASRNIAVTKHVSERISLPRTRVIYHGVTDSGDSSAFEGLHDVREPFKIGYVGRLVSEKGLPLLLNAAKRLDDDGFRFHLTIVGDGTEREHLESQARELKFMNPVDFLGELHGEALEQAVRPIQVIVMPSQCEETAGLAAIEQMMRGGVVVAADIGGLGEVVDEGGLKFPMGDSDGLYSRLRELIERPSFRASLRVAARKRAVQAFGRDSMIDAHVSTYHEVLGR